MIRLINFNRRLTPLNRVIKFHYSTNSSQSDQSLLSAYQFILNQNLIESSEIKDSLHIKESPLDHRGIYTSKLIPKDTVILQELPVSALLSQSKSNQFNCPQCFGSIPTKPTPSKNDVNPLTNNHIYCSDECAYDSMMFHQIKEYQELQAHFNGELRQFPLLITNIIFEILKQFQQHKSSSVYKLLPLLSFVKQDFIPDIYKNDHALIKEKLFKNDETKMKYFDLDWYCKLMSVLDINSFKITTNDLKATGVGFYLLSSFFNHSCTNNLQVEFFKVGLQLKAVRDIQPGEQLYISYLDLEKFGNQTEAKNFLLQKYGFQCQCSLCKTVTI